MGMSYPLISNCSTVATAVDEASVVNIVLERGAGWSSRMSREMWFFMVLNTVVASSIHERCLQDDLGRPLTRSQRGARRSAV